MNVILNKSILRDQEFVSIKQWVDLYALKAKDDEQKNKS